MAGVSSVLALLTTRISSGGRDCESSGFEAALNVAALVVGANDDAHRQRHGVTRNGGAPRAMTPTLARGCNEQITKARRIGKQLSRRPCSGPGFPLILAAMRDVLAIILGGGRGSRLFPLTHSRSKPAVPIGGKYRLIDIPISNCLHADIRRIFVLTQFNSASLNRHIAQTYRLDVFTRGLRRDPGGRADARQLATGSRARPTPSARRAATSSGYDADYYLILAGDHLYRMDYGELDRGAHRARRRHHDCGAAGDAERRDRDGHLPLRRRRPDRRLRGEAEHAERLAEIGAALPPGARFAAARRRDGRSSRRWASMSSRARCCSRCSSRTASTSARKSFRRRSARYSVNAFLHRGYWADVGTIGPSTTRTSC